jgi:hypothetical protein
VATLGPRQAALEEGGAPFGARNPVQSLPRLLVDLHHAPAGCTPLTFEGSACWVAGAPGCLHPDVLRCSASRQVAVVRARNETFERVQTKPMATSARLPRELFVSVRNPAVNDTRRWSNSEHEAKGHERATATVQPVNVTLWTQDRVDRKRSWREYPTNTGARFTGLALCSPSQREERTLCYR